MSRRIRGRKVKHTRKIYRKRKTSAQKVFSVVLTIVLIIGLAVLGYSIGKPVTDFLKERKSSPNKDDSSAVWTPPAATSTQSGSETTTSNNSDPNKPNQTSQELTAFSLPIEALANEQSLNSAVASAKSGGYTSVVVTLKADGGSIYYATDNQTAKATKAVVGTIPISTIVKTIKDNGLTPIAEVSVLKDHIAPRQNVALSYTFEGENSLWLDNTVANGGKAWMSPFKEASKTYISELSNEIAKAGFTKIIASDIVFPKFRNSDMSLIGSTVKDTNRHTALTATAQLIKKQTDAVSGETYVKVSAVEAISGKSEVFVPAELEGISFVAEINLSQITGKITLKDSTVLDTTAMTTYDKVKSVLTKTSGYAGKSVLVPYIVKTGLSDTDYNEIVRALKDMGYKTYIVK